VTGEQAQARLQETGQERLLQLIGTTARLEFRPVLQEVPAASPEGERLPLTCATELERQQPECSFEALADQQVYFLGEDGQLIYQLGPVGMTGDAIDRAAAVFATATGGVGGDVGWQIDFELTGEGTRTFADLTTSLVNRQLAIVLDQAVVSAPVVQNAITNGQGQITGSFTEQEAKDLATVLNAGALPVQLSQSEVRTVSPTLGEESLRQGLIAGIAGLAALMLYLLLYYRVLGVVAWLGQGIWAAFALGLVSLLGETVGYSLTLAGVAGIVVSLGITTDSYIVFFERLKDEVRRGRTPRSAVVPAFQRAWHTIVAADIVTILAAAVLYVLAVGSVRGFALTLGFSTALDMVVVYFFKRPTVFLIARNERLTNLRGFGLTSGVAAEPVPVPGGGR
jgi:preprotein translocase subunit SecD